MAAKLIVCLINQQGWRRVRYDALRLAAPGLG